MTEALKEIQVIVFDLMGTCTDWHSSILAALQASPPHPQLSTLQSLSDLASKWREEFFVEIHRRFNEGLEPEDIDVTHRRILDAIAPDGQIWDETVRNDLVQSWHIQTPWNDTIEGIERLKKKFFVIVLANGTTRLQLDIAKSSRIPFHTLLSSQLLGLTKPDPAIYLKTLELVAVRPEQALMVAAHAYDLRAAAKTGMKTAYIYRATEDLTENFATIRRENNLFIDGRNYNKRVGLVALADALGC